MEQKVLVGTNTGLSLLVKSRNQSYSITALNESELEYTLTLSFEGSVNLRFVPKRTDVQTLNPTNFKVVVPGYQSKKVISAGLPLNHDVRLLSWLPCGLDPDRV